MAVPLETVLHGSLRLHNLPSANGATHASLG